MELVRCISERKTNKGQLTVGKKYWMDVSTKYKDSDGDEYAQIYLDEAKTQKITVVDDGTSSNETRLGAVRDIQYAIDELGLDDDMLVIAGDNLLDFSLTSFITYAKNKNSSCIMRYYEDSMAKLVKCGVVTIDENDKVLRMTEKSPEPETHWCCPPFYYYTREDAKLIPSGIEAGCGVDAPGSYIAWLCTQVPVHAMEMPGSRYDIGNLESYEQVQKDYKGI